jgi:ABC-2 type transport system ATP-binding protein
MDEAERCHRLAFIFRGTLLDVGTPDEIVARRNLEVVELSVPSTQNAIDAARALRQKSNVEEIAHYGHILRLATRNNADPERLVRETLGELGIPIERCRTSRPTVEDAFVSMVREDSEGGRA